MRPSASRGWRQRVEDILEAITKIERFTATETFETFRTNEILQDAIAFNFLVLGEAATHVPNEIQEHDPSIPWANMRDMRNIVAHNYRGLNLRIVWQTIVDDFESLVTELTALLDAGNLPASS